MSRSWGIKYGSLYYKGYFRITEPDYNRGKTTSSIQCSYSSKAAYTEEITYANNGQAVKEFAEEAANYCIDRIKSKIKERVKAQTR